MPYTLNPYRRAHAIDLYARAATLRKRLGRVTQDGEQLRIPAAYRYGKRVDRVALNHELDEYRETETHFGTLTETDGMLTLTTPFGQTVYPAHDDQYTLYDRLYQNAECVRSLLWRAIHDALSPEEEPTLVAHLTTLDAFLLRETFTRNLALSHVDEISGRLHALLDEWRLCDDERFVRETTADGDLFRYHRRIVGVIHDNHLVTPIGTRRIQKDAPHKTWANLRKTMRRQLNQWTKQWQVKRYDPDLTLVQTFSAFTEITYLWEKWSSPDMARDTGEHVSATYVRDMHDAVTVMCDAIANAQRLATLHPEDGVDYARPVASFAGDERLRLLRRLRTNPNHALHRLHLVRNGGDADLFDYTPHVAFDEAMQDVTLTFDGQTERFAHIRRNRYGRLHATVGDRYHVLEPIDDALPPVLVQGAYATFVNDSVRQLRLTERLADYDAAPLDRSKRDLLFHSLPYVALVKWHVFARPSTACKLPHRHHIRRLLQDAYQNVHKAENCPYESGPPPKRYQEKALGSGLLDSGYDVNDAAISALNTKQRLALLHDDVQHLTYLATLASGRNTSESAIVRPERDALIDLFERHIALAQQQLNGYTSERLRRDQDAYTDLVALLETDWYDQLPEVLEVDR